MAFAFLFGLSMDYEVFILVRVREEYGRSGATDALILFLACASLASAPNTEIEVLATGLGFGTLLDASLPRALAPPAVVLLLGHWN